MKAKKIKNMSDEAIMNRVNDMVAQRKEFMSHIDDVHVKLQQGNSKTGKSVWTVSLIPIADCKNCSGCRKQCYDIINVCFQPKVKTDRARNSAIHMADIERFWNEISYGVRYNYVPVLRLNVGGDFSEKDFPYIKKVAEENPKCDFLFFTKAYDDLNRFLDENEFPSNVQAIMSPWKDMEMDNRHNLPCAHVLYEDGTTTAPDYGSYFCKGNCSECHYCKEGCFNLKKGESVIFTAH